MRLAKSAASLMTVYFQPLIEGDRLAARTVVEKALASGVTAYELLTDLVWPMMEKIQSAYKDDLLDMTQLNLATRLNRFIADFLGSRLEVAARNGRRVLLLCGNAEPEELGGQITADLFQAAGYDVKFAGGGVPDDEVLKLVGEYRPALLVLFATLPANVPNVRKLIDYLREVNSNPEMQVMCCGGIYKRAEGLAEEIGADLYAADGADAVNIATGQPGRRATVDQQTVGRSRRVRKAAQRRTPIMGRIAPRAGAEEGEGQRAAAM